MGREGRAIGSFLARILISSASTVGQRKTSVRSRIQDSSRPSESPNRAITFTGSSDLSMGDGWTAIGVLIKG